jgi:hypothetical protein
MYVTELINFISHFIFGRNEPTEDDRDLYLRYLNLADYELFRCTKNSRRFLQELDLFFPLQVVGQPIINYTALPTNYVAEVYTGKIKLQPIDLLYNLEMFDTNHAYHFLDNNIYINTRILQTKVDPSDNNTKPYVKLIIQPLRKTLVENVADANTQINIPIYPESYHLALIHGAVYFLFLSQKGFTEKIQYAIKNWQEAKSDLTGYYSQDK